MSRILCVHIMTTCGSVPFFLKNVCYVQDFYRKSQGFFKDNLVTLCLGYKV